MHPNIAQPTLSGQVFFSRRRNFNLLICLFGVSLILVGCGLGSAPPSDPIKPTNVERSISIGVTPLTTVTTSSLLTATQAFRVTQIPTDTTPTPCPIPTGWVAHVVEANDTLTLLAALTGSTVEALKKENCLNDDLILIAHSLYLPLAPKPTSTPCGAPTGWIVYAVQPGDTLSRLALATGVGQDAIKRANCLNDDLIVIGQPLSLPFAPAPPAQATQPGAASIAVAPPTAPARPPTEPTTPACASDFSCRNPSLPVLPMADVGSPNESDTPCTDAGGNPLPSGTLAIWWPQAPKTIFAPGERAEFFPCEFPNANTLQAQLVGPDSFNKALELTFTTRHSVTYPMFAWDLLCKTTAGDYRIIVTDHQGHRAERVFQVTPQAQSSPTILVIPPAGPPGTKFQVYFCNYPPEFKLIVNLFQRGKQLATNEYEYEHVNQYIIQVKAEGWGEKVLISLKKDDDGVYKLLDNLLTQNFVRIGQP
jgi:LysM repeat protein